MSDFGEKKYESIAHLSGDTIGLLDRRNTTVSMNTYIGGLAGREGLDLEDMVCATQVGCER